MAHRLVFETLDLCGPATNWTQLASARSGVHVVAGGVEPIAVAVVGQPVGLV
jgi:hypothetical protein